MKKREKKVNYRLIFKTMVLPEKTTHSCGDGYVLLCKLMSLFHHSGRKVANDAHLVHVSATVDLVGNGNSRTSRGAHIQCEVSYLHETNNIPCVLQWNINGGFKKRLSDTLPHVLSILCLPVRILSTYASWPEDSAALLWYKLRIHINHLTLPDVDKSAVRSDEVIQGSGHRENIWVAKTRHDHEDTRR